MNGSKLCYLWHLTNHVKLSTDPSTKRIQIDEQSFFKLYESHWKKLYQLALQYTENGFQAEGVVQEVFTSVWKRRESLELTESTALNYLVRAVRFRVFRLHSDELRTSRKMEEIKARQPDSANHTEQDVLYRFLKEDVDQLISLLPNRCKEVYLLSRERGMNNQEIAKALLISEKTVENQLTKALNFIRKGLETYPR